MAVISGERGRVNGRAITFDFHNTLAACPEWFELEVKTLPSAFLQWWGEARERTLPPAALTEADGRYRQLRREIMEHGNELTAEACLETVFTAMRLDVPEDAVAAGVSRLMRQALVGAAPVPGAVAAVHAIHDAGVPVGVVSSAVYHPFLEWTLESFGIRQAMRVIVTSASAGFYKSRPELFWHAAQVLGSAPEQMVHVGDSLRFDVGGASRAGMGTVWLRHDGSAQDDEPFMPDLTLTTMEASAPEILDVLRSRIPDADGARA
jgi:FMN phosphatase YigB (HAD superfamily)